jgi:AraC-like DNA-binding protein
MADAEIQYEEFTPPARLGEYVRCIWRLAGPPGALAAPELVIPDACAELVINLGDPFIRHADGPLPYAQPLRLFAGQISRAITIQPSGRVDLWGVRFHPWSAAAFFGFSGAEMRDEIAPLDSIATSLERELEAVVEAGGADSQRDAITQGLTRYLTSARSLDARVPRLIGLINARAEDLSVRGLAREAGMSARRVQMLFRDEVGLSPKRILRINRFQYAIGLRRAHPGLTWTAIAARARYHDHAHFAHDSRDIAGCAPSELFRGEVGLTEVFLAEGGGR